jgi:hypothetical protein
MAARSEQVRASDVAATLDTVVLGNESDGIPYEALSILDTVGSSTGMTTSRRRRIADLATDRSHRGSIGGY